LTALFAIVLTVVASCTAKPTAVDYMRVTVGGQPTLGMTKRDVPPRGLVIFFHGLDKDETVLTADQPHKAMTDKLVNSGFAVVASRAGGNSYGNPASQRTYRELAHSAVEHYHTANIYLLAESMGAIAAADLLASGDPPRVLGLAAINPLLNLDNPPPEHQAAVAASFPNQSTDPVNPIDLPAGSFQGRKLRLYVTSDDSLVRPDANALTFKARFGSVAEIAIVPCTGLHLDPSCIEGDDIVKWFTHLESNAKP
jgi:alpha-beta hydrolase superfamily lysophospholipase